MKITRFERSDVRAVAVAAETALKEVAAKFGLTMTYRGGSFAETNATLRFEFATAADADREANAFRTIAPFIGMKAEDLGREFKTAAGQRFKIVGYRNRGKYRIIAEDVITGKLFKFAAHVVVTHLNRKGAA